jgi:hypothetical protein
MLLINKAKKIEYYYNESFIKNEDVEYLYKFIEI